MYTIDNKPTFSSDIKNKTKSLELPILAHQLRLPCRSIEKESTTHLKILGYVKNEVQLMDQN